jgi:hypothetical protein
MFSNMWLVSENQKLLTRTISTTNFKCVFYNAVYKGTIRLVQTNTLRASLIIVAVGIVRPVCCAGRRETFQPGIKLYLSNGFSLIPFL